MVNKQYNVHNPKLSKTKNYSPPPLRNFPVVSTQPNPSDNNQDTISDNNSTMNTNSNLDTISEEVNNPQNVYGRNLTYYNNESVDNHANNNDRLSVKDLTISDIGRFQYILQMDREVGTHADNLFRFPSSQPQSLSNATSTTNSINSNHQNIQFWKAGSQSPITSAFTRSNKRITLQKFMKLIWRYSKWPLGLLLVCSILGLIVYFLVADTEESTKSDTFLSDSNEYLVEENLSIDFNDFNRNDLDAQNPTIIAKTNATSPKLPFGLNNDLLAIFIKKPTNSNDGFTLWTSTEQNINEETPAIVEKVTENVRKTSTISLKDYTKSMSFFDQDTTTITQDDDQNKQKALPTQETLQTFGFTSGHQNNFGIPIEEDERILKMLNEQLIRFEKDRENTSISTSTTDSSLYRTKVSPTLPILSRYEITTEGFKLNVSDDGICKSTSLPLCRGVSPYDLTISKNKHLTDVEYQHFQYLINSKCSVRVAEFVCLVLEPECRPTQMGTLQPCKRICKSILEPCAHIIASSEILTTTFDCDSYEDSSDRNVCEDPTRRQKCYANEFKCSDSTCIPLQWKCDNIKDCHDGGDEYECKFCERDEFRCLSNDKCILDKWRCDQYDDCPDGSDESDCYYDDQTTFPSTYANDRVYPFVQVQVPNSPNGLPYLTISNEDRINTADQKKSYNNYDDVSDDDKFEPTAAENVAYINKINQSTVQEVKKVQPEIQTEAASSRAILIAKTLSNFQDSKEIMMTSDSENDFKYSSTSRAMLTTSHLSPCPEGELRCVSGVCISVSQLCDKVTDCADGADEAMCVYKDDEPEQNGP